MDLDLSPNRPETPETIVIPRAVNQQQIEDNLAYLQSLKEKHPDYFASDKDQSNKIKLLSALLDPQSRILDDLMTNLPKGLLNQSNIQEVVKHLGFCPEMYSFPKDQMDLLAKKPEYFEQQLQNYLILQRVFAVITILSLVDGANTEQPQLSDPTLRQITDFLNTRYKTNLTYDQMHALSKDKSKNMDGSILYKLANSAEVGLYDTDGTYARDKFRRDNELSKASFNGKSLYELYQDSYNEDQNLSRFGSDRKSVEEWVSKTKNKITSCFKGETKDFRLDLINNIFNKLNSTKDPDPRTTNDHLSQQNTTSPTSTQPGSVFIGAVVERTQNNSLVASPLIALSKNLGINLGYRDGFVSTTTLAGILNFLVKQTNLPETDTTNRIPQNLLSNAWVGLFNGRTQAEINEIFSLAQDINPDLTQQSVIKLLKDQSYAQSTYANNFWKAVTFGYVTPQPEEVKLTYVSDLIQSGWSAELNVSALTNLDNNSPNSSIAMIGGLSRSQLEAVSKLSPNSQILEHAHQNQRLIDQINAYEEATRQLEKDLESK